MLSDFRIGLNKIMPDRLNEFVNPQFDSRSAYEQQKQSCFHCKAALRF